MTQEQKEIYEAVEILNDNLLKISEEKHPLYEDWYDKMPEFSISFSIGKTIVELYLPSIDTTFPIYNSEHEDREFNEELNCYEPFCDYVQKKFKLIKEDINSNLKFKI